MNVQKIEKSDRPEIVRPSRDWEPGQYNLRDAWVPVAQPHEVTDKPFRRMIHSQPYYLWRERGELRAAEFHPREMEQKRKNATELTGGTGVYPIAERFASVWVWYGDPSHADEALIPDVPYLPRFGRLPRWMYDWVHFDSCSELSLENLLDLTHADFLHTGITGDEISESDKITVHTTSETVTMVRECERKKTPKFMRLMGVKSDYVDFRAVIHVFVRNHVALAFGRFTPGFIVPLFHPSIPESRYCCRINSLFNTLDAPVPFKYVMPRMSRTVGPQDNFMLRPQNPRYMIPCDRADFHSRFDGAGVAYRHLIQRIASRQAAGDFSYGADGDPGRDITELLRIKRVDDHTGRGLEFS